MTPDSDELPGPLNYDGRSASSRSYCGRCLPDERNIGIKRGAFGYASLCGPCYDELTGGPEGVNSNE